MTKQTAKHLMVANLLMLTLCQTRGTAVHAAAISWGVPFSIASTDDLISSGTLVKAVDFTDPAQTTERIVTTATGSITFTPVYGDDASLGGANYPYSDSYSGTQAFWPTDTGDAGLNDVLNGQVWTGTDGTDSLVTVTLSDLSIGSIYQLQIIGPADARTCCSARSLQADDSTDPLAPGNLGAVMLRSDAPSVVGTFVADATTQSFSIRGADPSPADPAIGGYLLRQVPEPGSLLLGAFTTMATLGIRRRPGGNLSA